MLQESDYHRWGTLYLDKISDQGKWVSYAMHYDDHADTLFVSSADAKKQYKIAGVDNGTFLGEEQFAMLSADTLSLIDLQSGQRKRIYGVEEFSFSSRKNLLITLENIQVEKRLQIQDRQGKIVLAIPNTNAFSLSPNGNEMLLTQKNGDGEKLMLLSLNNLIPKQLLALNSAGTFTGFEWQHNGQSAAFIYQNASTGSNDLYHFSTATKKTTRFMNHLPRGIKVADAMMSRLTISDDGSKVFFGLDGMAHAVSFSPDSVQVWSGNDKWIYPERMNNSASDAVPRMAAWWPERNRFLQIGAADRPEIFFNGNDQYAITYNPHGLGPQYKLNLDADYYLTDLHTGKTTLWLTGQSTEFNDISISPGGKYIAYFREGEYWVYDFKADKHTKIKTHEIKLTADDVSGLPDNYGIAGWGVNDSTLLFYDEFDLWTVTLPGGPATRITTGRENQCIYRLPKLSNDNTNLKFSRQRDDTIDMSRTVLFQTRTDTGSGYVIRTPDNKYTSLDGGEMWVSGIAKAKNSEVFVYKTERYDTPPDVRLVNKVSKPAIIYKSNNCQDEFYWGKSEIIRYSNAAGVGLKGILYYPANYNPARQYPMIVNIYEKQSSALHVYINPSVNNMIGFNISDLTAKGYFFLRPDLVYEKHDPGISATDCTVAATNVVIAKGLVSVGKVGLIGHSFGGYESNFIITHTDIFAAAVSGAGIANLPAHYLSVGQGTGQPEIFRYENQQWRMGKSLFEDRESYERNSPVDQAAKVNTPVLLWTGADDKQVAASQSISYYLALRRLGKKQMLFVYPHEGHVISNRSFQNDLTRRVQEWFGYYLKGEPPSSWLTDGIK